MGFRIAKRFSFDAAHHLPHLPTTHKCRRHHGHTYSVELILASTIGLDKNDFVIDYGELKPLKDFIENNLDHRDLNDVYPVMHTTAENLAESLYRTAHLLLDAKLGANGVTIEAVRVSETPNTWAEFNGF